VGGWRGVVVLSSSGVEGGLRRLWVVGATRFGGGRRGVREAAARIEVVARHALRLKAAGPFLHVLVGCGLVSASPIYFPRIHASARWSGVEWTETLNRRPVVSWRRLVWSSTLGLPGRGLWGRREVRRGDLGLSLRAWRSRVGGGALLESCVWVRHNT